MGLSYHIPLPRPDPLADPFGPCYLISLYNSYYHLPTLLYFFAVYIVKEFVYKP